jgi:hypothetical protein
VIISFVEVLLFLNESDRLRADLQARDLERALEHSILTREALLMLTFNFE